MIVIVMTLNSLYKNFDIITAFLLQIGDKIIDQIQNIFQLKKTKNFSKQANRDTRDLVIAFRDKR